MTATSSGPASGKVRHSPSPRHTSSSPYPALGNSKGPSPRNVLSPPYLALFSRHRQNDRFSTRPRACHPSGARRLSQNSRNMDALRGERYSLPSIPSSSRFARSPFACHDGMYHIHFHLSPPNLPAPALHGQSVMTSSLSLGNLTPSLLVPLNSPSFRSPTFPSTCLSPDQPGYGQVVSTASGRRRPRRTNQSAAPITSTSLSQQPWSSSIPVLPGPLEHAIPYHRSDQDSSPHIHNALYSYPPPRQLSDARVSSPMQRGRQPSPASTSPLVRERSLRSRYSPYPSSVVAQRKPSSESMSLDIPSISLHDPVSDPRSSNRLPGDEIRLPPIQPLAPPRHVSNPSYALPPISALEDLRGVSSQDSVAVLERLKMDDAGSDADDARWARHRSFSASVRSVTRFFDDALC